MIASPPCLFALVWPGRNRTRAPGIVKRALDIAPFLGFLLLIGAAGGCRTLSRSCPADRNVVAGRELSRMGAAAMRDERFDEAEIRLTHALRQCPNDPEIRRNLGQLYWKSGKRQAAIEQMDLAVQLSGNDPEWTAELGHMLLEEKATDAAWECAQRIKNQGLVPLSAALEGDVLLAQGRLEEAQKAYLRAVAVDEPSMTVLLSLAETYARQGKHQRALATLRRLEDQIVDAQHPPDLPLRQGLALQALGRHEQAIERLFAAQERLGPSKELEARIAMSRQALDGRAIMVATTSAAIPSDDAALSQTILASAHQAGTLDAPHAPTPQNTSSTK